MNFPPSRRSCIVPCGRGGACLLNASACPAAVVGFSVAGTVLHLLTDPVAVRFTVSVAVLPGTVLPFAILPGTVLAGAVVFRGVLLAEFTAVLDVFLDLLLQLLALLGVPRRQLDGLLCLDAGLELASALHLCVELS